VHNQPHEAADQMNVKTGQQPIGYQSPNNANRGLADQTSA
jgi:hypothetical protein